MRPGRLDRILYVSPPDYSARLEIFKVNFSKMSTALDVSIEKLAEMVSSRSRMQARSKNSDNFVCDRRMAALALKSLVSVKMQPSTL